MNGEILPDESSLDDACAERDGAPTHEQLDASWLGMLHQLVFYKTQHGHCKVQKRDRRHPKLAAWLDDQVVLYHKNKLPELKQRELEVLGVDWGEDETEHRADKNRERRWEARYEELLAFKQTHGHCQVPNSTGELKSLSEWVSGQRGLYRKGKLSPERTQRLEEIGFAWKSDKLHFKQAWDVRYAELVAFKEKHGHLHVTKSNQTSEGMMHWRDNQRLRYQSGVMPPEQIERLEALGFDWEPPGAPDLRLHEQYVALWESQFAKLLAFRDEHGHCRVPKTWPADPSLSSWVRTQSLLARNNTLLPARRQRLEEAGVVLQLGPPRQSIPWEARYEELAAFKQKHGHLKLLRKYMPSASLVSWRDVQRQRFRSGKLHPEQKAKLDALGFEWQDPNWLGATVEERSEALWENRLAEILAFKEAHGHCQVPKGNGENDLLAEWVQHQRRHFREGTLSPERRQRLEEIGFAWKSDKLHYKEGWEARFTELVAFKEKHGHLNVTMKNQSSAGFKHWRDNQRLRYQDGVMPAEQKEKLEALGFEWVQPGRLSPFKEVHLAAQWENMFARLLVFREKHGHCQVPSGKEENQSLASWVVLQRKNHRDNTLLPERRQRLEEIGFAWKSDRLHFTKGWEGRYAELVAFKERHGHLLVTKMSQSSEGFMHWRDNQRIRFKNGSMPEDQRAKLEAIGFDFEPPGQTQPLLKTYHESLKWKRHYIKLVEFHRVHGHSNVLGRTYKELRSWVLAQRRAYQEGTLDPDQIARLERLGFSWQHEIIQGNSKTHPDSGKAFWDLRFAELESFVAAHGHFRVPKRAAEFRKLFNWVTLQRVNHRSGCLQEWKQQKLEAIGFPWAPGKEMGHQFTNWEQRYQELAAYKEKHGHTRMSREKADERLRTWLVIQRLLHRRGKLPAERVQKLETLGVEWNPAGYGRNRPRTGDDQSAPKSHLTELREFHAQHGHADVPTKYPANPALGVWVSNTRTSYRKGTLSTRRIAELEALGFRWHVPRTGLMKKHSAWEAKLTELEEYRRVHGHMRVGFINPEHRKLAMWVSTQRVQHQKGTLAPQRVKRLNAIGFIWGRAYQKHRLKKLAEGWEQHLAQLTEYRSQHGHPHVSKAIHSEHALATWASGQRYLKRQGVLSQEQIQQLDSLGFRWDGRQALWQRQWKLWQAATQRRRTRHLTLNGSTDDPLAKWEQIQRHRHHRGRLPEDKASLLQRCGLVFEEKKPTRKPTPNRRATPIRW